MLYHGTHYTQEHSVFGYRLHPSNPSLGVSGFSTKEPAVVTLCGGSYSGAVRRRRRGVPLVVSAAALLGRVAVILHGLVFRSGPVQTLIGALPESAWVHVETIRLDCKVQATNPHRSISLN